MRLRVGESGNQRVDGCVKSNPKARVKGLEEGRSTKKNRKRNLLGRLIGLEGFVHLSVLCSMVSYRKVIDVASFEYLLPA